MDLDERPKRRDVPIEDVEKEDLDAYSRDELRERIVRLEDEIKRTQLVLEQKGDSQSAAEALFGKSDS